MDRLREGLNALFFLIAIVLLAYNTFGVLTVPGYIMAVTAIFLIYFKQYYWVGMIGIFTAAGSFTAQYLTYFCPYCTAAAFCFFIGGLINLRGKYQENLPTSILSTICITTALTLFIFAPVSGYEPEVIMSDKPLLYFSTECRACSDVVEYLVKTDQTGEKWLPVILGDYAKGEKYLVDKGFTGETLTATQPPGKVIPALVVEGEIYEGSETIKHYFKEDEHGDY